ncbi:MAG TPA: hypothetical protein VJ183_00800 [Chloroflexia bacterium]|nr:hypothetical protein [Chloroflexia bacterium]
MTPNPSLNTGTPTVSASPPDPVTRSVLGRLLKGRSGQGETGIEDPRGEPQLKLNSDYIIRNKTAKRIGIENKSGASIGNDAINEGREDVDSRFRLIIPAFGTRIVTSAIFEELDHEKWERYNLISVQQKDVQVGTRVDTSVIVFGCLFWWIALAGSVVFFASSNIVGWSIFGLVLAGILVALLMTLRKLRLPSGDKIASFVVQFVNLLLLLAISIGLPLSVVLFSGEGLNWIQNGSTDAASVTGRILQLAIVVIFSSLPGLLYFQFARQQVAVLREKFLREIMLLNPNVQTLDDAEVMYGTMVDEVSGSVGANYKQYSVLGTGRPLLLSTLLITAGWILTLPVVGQTKSSTVYEFLSPQPVALSFAFLGAYFFALNMIFRRYARSDLTHKAYSHIVVRILTCIIATWAVSILPVFGAIGSSGDWLLLAVAFSVGIFPESGAVLIQDVLQKKPFGNVFPSLREEHPITKLEGITLYDRVRLLEEGVENVENLAHSDIIELMLRTRIPTPRLVDLIDQAILYLHVRDISGTSYENKAIQLLRLYGIRTATDLIAAYDIMLRRPVLESSETREDSKGSLEEGQLLGILDPPEGNRPQRLQIILDTIWDDEWLTYLQHWRENTRINVEVWPFEKFYMWT